MIKSRVVRLASALHHRVWITRAVTLGVRTLVLGSRGVFLVRHSYVPGWYLPGGGVDRGESAEAAAVRELREEGGIRCLGRPVLHGFFRNGRRDHVACYVVRDFEAPDTDAVVLGDRRGRLVRAGRAARGHYRGNAGADRRGHGGSPAARRLVVCLLAAAC